MDFNTQNIVSQLLSISMKFAIAFVPLFIGVYAKESYSITHGRKRKINIKNMILSSLTISCVVIGFISWGIEKYGTAFTFSLLFLLGVLNDKIIAFIMNGKLTMIILTFMTKMKSSLQDSIIETINKEETNERRNHTKDKDKNK